MSRKISHSFINGRAGAGTGGQGLKVEWDSTNDGELHWMDVDESTLEVVPPFSGPGWCGTRGIIAGGNIAIDYITIATAGNATSFGNMLVNAGTIGACSNGSRGLFGGGNTGSYLNSIEYITIATTGNATDFGDRTIARNYVAGCSNGSRGCFGGGDYPATNVIDYVTIATTGNATDFGDLTQARNSHDAFSGDTRGVFCGGHTGSAYLDTIDYITIATTGNATDFGNQLAATSSICASNSTRGIIVAGNGGYQIQYVTTATTGNSTDFGDLTVNGGNFAGMSDGTYAVFGAGSGSRSNVIDYITIMTTGNATDFGDLDTTRTAAKGCSGS